MISNLFADELPALDVRAMARQRALAPGARSRQPVINRQGVKLGELQLVGGWSQVTVAYEVDGVLHRHPVRLDYTDCHLGNRRCWWRCPSCGRRAALLVFSETAEPGCRGCIPRLFSVQCAGDLEVLARRVARARRKLGPGGRRPRHMRWRTYRWHLDEVARAEAALRQALLPLQERVRHG